MCNCQVKPCGPAFSAVDYKTTETLVTVFGTDVPIAAANPQRVGIGFSTSPAVSLPVSTNPQGAGSGQGWWLTPQTPAIFMHIAQWGPLVQAAWVVPGSPPATAITVYEVIDMTNSPTTFEGSPNGDGSMSIQLPDQSPGDLSSLDSYSFSDLSVGPNACGDSPIVGPGSHVNIKAGS